MAFRLKKEKRPKETEAATDEVTSQSATDESEHVKPSKEIYLRILVNLLLCIALVVLVILFLGDLLRFFMPFVIAFFIAAIANPMVRFLEKKMKVKRKHGTVIIIVLVLAVVVGLLYLIGYIVVQELIKLVGDLPSLMEQGQELISEITEKLQGLYNRLPDGLQKVIDNVSNGLSGWFEKTTSNFEMPSLLSAGGYVKGFLEGLLIAIITLIASYFFIADRDKIVEGIVKITPSTVVEYYKLTVSTIKKAVGGYFKAQFKLMLIIVVILFIGFELLGVDYSFLLALLTSILDFLPVFGTGTIIGPWVVVDIITGHYTRAVVLTILYIVCQLVKQLLQPKMVGDSIKMNPLATLLFMFVGYRFKGIFGMIIGIPVGMVFVNFYRMGMFDRIIRGFKIIANSINDFRKY